MSVRPPIGAAYPQLARWLAEHQDLSDVRVYDATRAALRAAGYELKIVLWRGIDGARTFGPWVATSLESDR